MLELITSTVRKKNKANAAGIILAFSLVLGVCLGVNIFIGPKSPMASLNIPFLIGMILLFVWWLILYKRLKHTMTLSMDNNKDYFISIPLKNGETITLNKISAIEPIFGRVSYGKGPRMKDIYLKIFDEKGNNGLTLFHNLGAIHDAPDEFFELEEYDLLKYNKGETIYFCKDIQEIYYTLKEGKFITIKQPTGV